MNIVETNTTNGIYKLTNHTVVEDVVQFEVEDYPFNGLFKKYNCYNNNDADFPWYPINATHGRTYGQEFSLDNQEILKTHLLELLEKKEKIVIVEIGVHRNLENSSTEIFLQNKRDVDIYIGIDIDDKTFLNNPEKNIFTIKNYSQNIESIFQEFKTIGIEQIDLFMIDGYHSINQVYLEWEKYTPLLSFCGIVVMHDTNSHPGPYFLTKSIDTNIYDVKKYLSDVVDWGISVAIKK